MLSRAGYEDCLRQLRELRPAFDRLHEENRRMRTELSWALNERDSALNALQASDQENERLRAELARLRGTAEAGGFQPHTSAAHAVAEPTPSEKGEPA